MISKHVIRVVIVFLTLASLPTLGYSGRYQRRKFSRTPQRTVVIQEQTYGGGGGRRGLQTVQMVRQTSSASVSPWIRQNSETLSQYLSRLQASGAQPSLQDMDNLLARASMETLAEYRYRIDGVKQLYSGLPWNNTYFDTGKGAYVYNTGKYVTNANPLRAKYLKRYSRKQGQSDKDFYERLLEMYEGEKAAQYEERIRVLKEVFPDADWAHVYFSPTLKQYVWVNSANKAAYNTATKGQTEAVTRKSNEALSESEEDREQWIKRKGESLLDVYQRVMKMKEGESFKRYFDRILSRAPFDNDITYYLRIKYLKNKYPQYPWQYIKYNEQRRDYDLDLPDQYIWTGHIPGESDEAYLLRVFKRQAGEADEAYWTRLLQRASDDTEDSYQARILRLRALFPELYWTEVGWREDSHQFVHEKDIVVTHYWEKRSDETWLQYYWRLFPVVEGESEEQYLQKVLRRFEGETDDQYKQRVASLRQVFVNVPWSHVVYDETTKSYVFDDKVEVNSNIRDIVVDNTQHYILWLRREGESDDEYIRRLYSKDKSETDSQYFLSVLHRFSGESVDSYRLRMQKLQSVFVNAPWNYVSFSDNKKEYILEKLGQPVPVSRNVQDIVINGKQVHIDDYYTRREGESELAYYRRVYPAEAGETEAAYLRRLLLKRDGESDAEYQARVASLRNVFIYAPWSEVNYDQQTGQYQLSKDAVVSRSIYTVVADGQEENLNKSSSSETQSSSSSSESQQSAATDSTETSSTSSQQDGQRSIDGQTSTSTSTQTDTDTNQETTTGSENNSSVRGLEEDGQGSIDGQTSTSTSTQTDTDTNQGTTTGNQNSSSVRGLEEDLESQLSSQKFAKSSSSKTQTVKKTSLSSKQGSSGSSSSKNDDDDDEDQSSTKKSAKSSLSKTETVKKSSSSDKQGSTTSDDDDDDVSVCSCKQRITYEHNKLL